MPKPTTCEAVVSPVYSGGRWLTLDQLVGVDDDKARVERRGVCWRGVPARRVVR